MSQCSARQDTPLQECLECRIPHGDVDRVVAKGDVRRPDRDERAEEQRVEDVEVAPNVLVDTVMALGCHKFLYQV